MSQSDKKEPEVPIDIPILLHNNIYNAISYIGEEQTEKMEVQNVREKCTNVNQKH